MKGTAYIDTSFLLAVTFNESGSAEMARKLKRYPRLLSSNLLEAEIRAAFAREKIAYVTSVTQTIRWVLPERNLAPEIARVLTAGYVRGADCWHLATALYVFPEPAGVAFLTADQRQSKIASVLGFDV